MESMTGAPGQCKGCSASVRLRREDVDRIVSDYLRNHPDEALVADTVYDERLSHCRVCSDLEYGTTCRHCGCIVQLMARLANKRCPRPAVPAW
ncbi:MAG: DUF6171 family protein [Candidatus Sumerlaeota bacterium]|nr:DUF6171 family protein [Candidatus Sumerlaeota bacterium]